MQVVQKQHDATKEENILHSGRRNVASQTLDFNFVVLFCFYQFMPYNIHQCNIDRVKALLQE